MLLSLERLALAYVFTEDDAFARKADALLEAWFLSPTTGMTPHFRYGQVKLGEAQGTPGGLIEARGFYALPRILELIAASSAFRMSTKTGVEMWFHRWLEWLESDTLGIKEIAAKNNHGSFIALQRISWARSQGDASKARAHCEMLVALMNQQIDADGSQPLESARADSFHYHVFNLHALMLGEELCRSEGVDLWTRVSPSGAGLTKAVAYLMPTLRGEARWPLPQSEYFDVKSFRETVALLRWNGKMP